MSGYDYYNSLPTGQDVAIIVLSVIGFCILGFTFSCLCCLDSCCRMIRCLCCCCFWRSNGNCVCCDVVSRSSSPLGELEENDL